MAKIKKLKLTTDKSKADKIVAEIANLKTDLELRIELWDRLTLEKKTTWAKGGNDPAITIAYELYVYLGSWFREVQDG